MKTLGASIRVIAFDWGDTLMVNDPQQSGPMVDWPRVAAVQGAEELLASLKPNFKLVLASNAQGSNREQIRAALERAGLARYVDEIYTMHELQGARKPERAFFERLAAHLGVQSQQILMVGDEYLADVAGPSAAGLQTVWFNPSQQPAPVLAPAYQSEITALPDLARALEVETLPSVADCRLWILEQAASGNLLVHVEMVAAVAYQIAWWARSSGLPVDPLLAHRGGLLHDVCKISAHHGPVRHPEAGARLLEGKGLPVLAEIVRHHGLFSLLEESDRPRTWEQRIVYYADKLIESNQIVPIEVRIQSIQDRYGLDPLVTQKLISLIRELETELCSPLGVDAERLNRSLQKAFTSNTPLLTPGEEFST